METAYTGSLLFAFAINTMSYMEKLVNYLYSGGNVMGMYLIIGLIVIGWLWSQNKVAFDEESKWDLLLKTVSWPFWVLKEAFK